MTVADWYFCYCTPAPQDDESHSPHCAYMNARNLRRRAYSDPSANDQNDDPESRTLGAESDTP